MIRESRIATATGSTRLLGVDGEGPAFVLLHGHTDSADTWRPLLGLLERAGRKAVAVDLPGFGAASAARPGPVLPQFEAAVVAAVETTGADGPPVLVGNSMGGLTALYVANRRSNGLAGVVPVCSAGLHHPLWIRLMVKPLGRSLVPLLASRPGKAAVAAIGSRQPSGVRGHLSCYLGHLDRPRLAHQVSIVERLLGEQDYPLEMGSIDCPVLFVWGAQDRAALWRRNGARILRLAERAPNARSEILRCGHTPQLETPGRLMSVLDDFSPAGRPPRLRPPANGHGAPKGG